MTAYRKSVFEFLDKFTVGMPLYTVSRDYGITEYKLDRIILDVLSEDYISVVFVLDRSPYVNVERYKMEDFNESFFADFEIAKQRHKLLLEV